MKRFLLGTRAFDAIETMHAFFASVFLIGGLAVGVPQFLAGNPDISRETVLSVILSFIGFVFVAIGLHSPNLSLKDSGLIRTVLGYLIFVMIFMATIMISWFTLGSVS